LEGSKISYKEKMKCLNASSTKSEDICLQLEINIWIGIKILKEKQEKKLNLILAKLRRTKAMLKGHVVRVAKVVKKQFGYHSII